MLLNWEKNVPVHVSSPLLAREQEVKEEECQRAEDRSVQMPTPSNKKVFWDTRFLGAILKIAGNNTYMEWIR